MTRPFRLLTDEHTLSYSSATASSLDFDFIVILAAILCALICLLGLVAVALCICPHRLRLSSTALIPQPPPLPSAANKGVRKKVLRSLPKLTLTAESAVKFSDCAICLSDFDGGDEIRVLPQCGHGFHVSCIDAWLLEISSCQRCGGLPASASSGSTSASVPEKDPEGILKARERENGGNRFLP